MRDDQVDRHFFIKPSVNRILPEPCATTHYKMLKKKEKKTVASRRGREEKAHGEDML